MAYNQSDALFEQGTDTNGNFGNSVSGQTNSFFLPKVYSKQVLNFFRKSSVAEAITNTDYSGDISGYGDTVRIIKEPVITVYQYERGADVTQTKLTDVETTLIVDVANAFKFKVDDIHKIISKNLHKSKYQLVDWLDETKLDWSVLSDNENAIDGNFFQTENNYTSIVYYRGNNERYDRVIGIANTNSEVIRN